MDFNRQQLVENINNLIQLRNMKVGEVEQAIGISTGYISRLSKAGNESIPATDVVWNLARLFGVSTDSLISGDYSSGNDNLSVLRRFVAKLKVQTMEGILDWSAVSTKYVNAVLKGEEPPFFLVKENDKDRGLPRKWDGFSEGSMTYPFYRNRRIISAAVPQNCVWMTGEGFKATLTGEKEIYLFRLCTDVETDTSAGDVETPYYEMYMAKRVSYEEMPWESSELSGNAHGECMTQQIFDTLRGGYVLEDAVKELYGAVEQAAYDLKIDTNVRSTIMDFLNDSNLGTEAAK